METTVTSEPTHLLTARALAAELGISVGTIGRLRRLGKIRYHAFGTTYRYDLQEVLEDTHHGQRRKARIEMVRSPARSGLKETGLARAASINSDQASRNDHRARTARRSRSSTPRVDAAFKRFFERKLD